MGEGSARSVVSRSQVDSIPFHHFVTLGARRKSGPNTREERVGQMREEIGQPCPCKDLVLEMASVALRFAKLLIAKINMGPGYLVVLSGHEHAPDTQ